MRKRILLPVFLTLLALVLCACGEKTPSEVVDEAAVAFQNQDTAALSELYNGKVDLESFFTQEDSSSELEAEAFKALADKLCDFDYEILDETIDGDTAKVEVKLTTYDFATVANGTMSQVFTTAFSMVFSDDEFDDSKTEELFNTVLLGKLGEQTEKTKTATIAIPLTRTESGWKIDKLSKDETFLDALSGGGYSAMKNFEDNLSALE
ncbi:MAG: hypothetical protein ACOX8R_02430 [Bacillota bacterium]|jgi:predicted small lipoprotein YifL